VLRNVPDFRQRPGQVDLARKSTNAIFSRGPSSIVIWLCLLGSVIPAGEVQIYLMGAKLTAGRIGILLLLLPALFKFFHESRRLLLCDFFASATAAWLMGAAFYTTGLPGLGSAGAEALEFWGGYVVARAFIFGPEALTKFTRVLKLLAIIIISLGIGDIIAGRPIVHQSLASLLNVPTLAGQVRTVMGIWTVRAMSTFDHSILFGTFCVIVAVIILYAERNMVRRTLWICFCILGILLSLSSAPLLGFAIGIGAYIYDFVLRPYPWRWKVIWWAIGAFLALVLAVTNNPLGWLITHFTLEPQSGYFRIMEWDLAISYILQSPLVGLPVNFYFGNILDVSVDCVWLVFALRAGLPMIAFLFLANVTACLPTGRSSNPQGALSYMDRMRTAFTVVLFQFMFIGLTVHFWNYAWILWGLCLGIRASLREAALAVGRQPILEAPPMRTRPRWA
jgi:hypothetical protein